MLSKFGMPVAKIVFLLSVFFVFKPRQTLSQGSPDQADITSEKKTQIDSFINEVIKCRGIAGATLAITRGSQTYTKGYGFADVPKGRQVNEDTLFNIGSVSKMFTVLLMVEVFQNSRRKPLWDIKITDLLGEEFALGGDLGVYHEATLKDVLSHRTGLDVADIGIFAGYENITREEYAKRLTLIPVAKPFRGKFSYNNAIFSLASYIAEKKSGQTWEKLMTDKVLKKAGMTSTKIINKEFFHMSNIAKPHFYDSTLSKFLIQDFSIYSLHPLESVGGICSNAKDMAKWLGLMMNLLSLYETEVSEIFQEQIVLNSEFRDYRVVRLPQFPVEDIQVAYCMGLMTRYYNGRKVFYHSGDFFSYSSMLWIVPSLQTSFFLSTNGPGDVFDPLTLIMYYLTDIFANGTSWLNGTTACTFPEPWAKPEESEREQKKFISLSIPTKRLEGVYGNLVIGDMTITVDKNNLFCKLGLRIRGTLKRLADQGPDSVLMFLELEGPLTTVADFKDGIYLNFLDKNPEGVYQHIMVKVGGDEGTYFFSRNTRFNDAWKFFAQDSGAGYDNSFSFYIIIIALIWNLSNIE